MVTHGCVTTFSNIHTALLDFATSLSLLKKNATVTTDASQQATKNPHVSKQTTHVHNVNPTLVPQKTT